ncbi:leader peptidase (prepilin peptidase)/N-methyltransferase [Motilibacter peucedani]|uniref:Prepilin leader peptidase/N-methyltransferase n=1 Tax=Motilibacter peucedani TaxID=598650 RepID=A0A420XS98_9ACTN|nr:A24 family peptidase [Motilibacter peucedani]RKS77758.1 leader peptidase (prepilin peptidase)/N-methyltransferase [Motilibacter peucedani]
MTALLAAECGVLGLLIGSFLNVVVWRVPRGESVVSPGSHCPSCGDPVRPRDNIPVLSWLLLRGRCRSCAQPISVRYPLVEAGTGALFALTAAWAGLDWTLPAFLYLAAITVALALIDLDVRRLPNAIVLPSYPVALLLLLLPAALDGRWDDLLRAVLAAVVLYALFFALAVAKPGGMGFGDVKLAGVVGLYLGWLGWPQVAVGAFLGFVLGGVAGGVMIAARRATRRSALPYGPFMLLGAALAVGAGGSLFDGYLSLLGA